jgi:hypothetical protein
MRFVNWCWRFPGSKGQRASEFQALGWPNCVAVRKSKFFVKPSATIVGARRWGRRAIEDADHGFARRTHTLCRLVVDG